MTGSRHPQNISWYEDHSNPPSPPPHAYYTRQVHRRRCDQDRVTKRRPSRVEVRSIFLQSDTRAQSMGGFLSKGHGMFCRVIKQMKTDGNGNFERVPPPTPPTHSYKLPLRVEMALDQPEEEKEVQAEHAWNPADRSLNIFVKSNDPFTFHRHPVAQSTDCIRGKQSYSRGLHIFEIFWPVRQRGTHAVVGVATKEAPIHSPGYTSLVGSTQHSWGWDLLGSTALHNRDNTSNTQEISYPRSLLLHEESTYQAPDRFLMVLDMDMGTLGFVAKGKYLGVAHTGLKGKTVFPIVSSVWGHCEVSMKYLTGVSPGPTSLAAWCRRSIRITMGKDRIDKGDIDKLILPTAIKEFLVYK